MRVGSYLVSALCALALPAHAAVSACPPECSVAMVEAHPHEALSTLAARAGVTIVVEGAMLPPITATITERSLDHLIRSTARRAGYVVARRGEVYTFYGQGGDEAPARITTTHPMRFLTADEAAEKLATFSEIRTSTLPDANAVVLRGSVADVREAVEILEAVDQARPNVFLELLVVEYFHGDSYTWSFDIVQGTKGKLSDVGFAPGLGALTGLYQAVADLPLQFRFNLTALVGKDQARVVTNPHVAVRNGQMGRIEFDEELHVVLTNEPANFGTTRTLEQLDAGVMLEITPQVTASGAVDLEVEGEVAVFTRAAQGQFAIDRQQIETTVIVDSGATLIIGGLVKKSAGSFESGVPVLRRIPLLGRLFRDEGREEQYVETVIYITPRVGDSRAFTPDVMRRNVEQQFEMMDEGDQTRRP